MIQILTYTGPKKKLDEENLILAKVQIDNCYDLGWKRDQILLVTDFPYRYRNIEAIRIKDGVYYDFDKTSNKIMVLLELFKNKLLNYKELYWYHDFDVYQSENISETKLNFELFDLGIIPYGYKPEWNLGSFFFRYKAKDIFEKIDQEILWRRKSNHRCDEKALKRLIIHKNIDKNRLKELNVTYNFTKRCIATNYRRAEKPLKAVHFHPWDKDDMMSDTALNLFMYGKNRIRIPLMSKRLINIFENHGIK